MCHGSKRAKLSAFANAQHGSPNAAGGGGGSAAGSREQPPASPHNNGYPYVPGGFRVPPQPPH